MIRLIAFLASLSLLTACGETLMDEAQEDLGTFKMRVGYIYTDKALQWPLSRNAEASDWNADLQNALDTRLRRYEGTQEYDVAITLEGFMLAPPGVPIVLNPKSVAVVNVFVYDVAGQEYLAKKHQMEIFESTTGESVILGSGHTRTKEEQIAGLSLNIVDAVEEWIAEQHLESGWFDERVENVEEDPAAPS
ncbi:hypothetical protein FEE96_14820 [Parasedimentitalea maritima]|uniref:Lipoprotein n=1 Tax=Parasedimentitalea maritima TaxID=2578117 RepID=A0A5R8Z6Z7_9RHOB|nr:hypothetical protein [Zongyanglinia marina]KAE9628901.1 hypothetical protein GP644_14135 [Zongyanglinia marina]TLP61510.1 hypothetical protein FEE96_14820 [Zongyanglinia marina]